MSTFTDRLKQQFPDLHAALTPPPADPARVRVDNRETWLAQARARRLSISAVHQKELVHYTATDSHGALLGEHKTAYADHKTKIATGWLAE